MIGDIKTVAQGTFDRYFRMKELYVIIALCIILVLIFGRYDELTLNMGREFMIDGALAILGVVGLITAMAVIFEKSREMREKTAHFIITKPQGRRLPHHVQGFFSRHRRQRHLHQLHLRRHPHRRRVVRPRGLGPFPFPVSL